MLELALDHFIDCLKKENKNPEFVQRLSDVRYKLSFPDQRALALEEIKPLGKVLQFVSLTNESMTLSNTVLDEIVKELENKK